MSTVDTRLPIARAALGVAVALLGVGSLVVLSVQPSMELHVSEEMSVYTKYEWALGAALVAAGLVLAVAGPLSTYAAAIGAILAGQLGAAGAGAFKQWYSFFGPTGFDSTHHDDLEQLGLAMAALCLVALAACLVYLARRRAFSDHETSGLKRGGLVVVAVVMAVGLPLALSVGDNSTNLETFGALGVLYSLPWGIALAASAWLTRPAATSVYATVLLSALLAAVSDHFVSMGSQGSAFGFAAALAALAGAIRRAQLR